MFRLLAWFILAHVGRVRAFQSKSVIQSGLALTTADWPPSPPPPCCWSYSFLLHRKAGEALLSGIAADLGQVLGMHSSTVYGGHADKCEDFPNTIGATAPGPSRNIREMLTSCPSTRMVLPIRRPSAMLASEYVYLKKLGPCSENGIKGCRHDFERDGRGAMVTQQSLSSALQGLCRSWFQDVCEFPSLRSEFEIIQQRKPEQVMIVRLEDFEKDYDNTTRSIFEHFLGSGDSRIDDLVTKAKLHDLSRMTPNQLNNIARHVSDKGEEAEVAAEMRKQFQAGDSCMAKVARMDELLGYSSALS